MDLDTELDLIQEKQEENARDILHEENMHGDIEYAMEHLGVNDITDTLETMSMLLSNYGHEFSVRELLDYLGLTDET
jgi:hypothetical protein